MRIDVIKNYLKHTCIHVGLGKPVSLQDTLRVLSEDIFTTGEKYIETVHH
jgi:hypothetical protein